MAASQSLRMSDMLRVQRLQGELALLPPLSDEWKEHLLSRVSRILSARLAMMPEVVDMRAGCEPRPRSTAVVGWLDDSDRQLLQHYHTRRDTTRINPAVQAFTLLRRRFFTHRRSDVVTDKAWYRSELVAEYLNPAGLGDELVTDYRVNDKGWIIGIDLFRGRGDPAFSQRDRNILHVLNAGLLPVYRAHLRPRDANGSTLSPRAKETLGYLLAGDSEKQIARRMDLSAHTVHQYVKAVYRHFGASSRAELLVNCLAPQRRHVSFETGLSAARSRRLDKQTSDRPRRVAVRIRIA